jgi:hypothetical protein
LDHIKAREILDPVEQFTDWKRFESLACALVSPRVEINSCIEADSAGRDFAASIASAYRLSTKTTRISDPNRRSSSLERLLKHKQRLRKLWKDTRDPACKTAVNWVTKTIRRIARKRALERWETKIENCEVTPQAIRPIAKSLTKRGEPKATTAIHDPLCIVFYQNEKANVIANYLENLFTPHKVCDTDHERRVEARVQDLLTTVDENTPVKFRPCDVSKEIRSLKLGEACGIDGISNECLRHLPRRSLVHITHQINRCLRLCHFPAPWKEAKIIALPKPGKNPKFPEN